MEKVTDNQGKVASVAQITFNNQSDNTEKNRESSREKNGRNQQDNNSEGTNLSSPRERSKSLKITSQGL